MLVGDGNGDGVLDGTQPAVASTTFLKTPTPQSNPTDALPVNVTLVVDALGGKVDPDANTAEVTQFVQRDAPANLPASLSMPLGLFELTATVAASGIAGVGTTETFSLYIDVGIGANGYWVQNAKGIWCNLASEAYGGKMVLEGGKLRLDFQLLDGGEFDTDGLVNGSVGNVGAVGNMPLSLVGFAQDVPDGGWF